MIVVWYPAEWLPTGWVPSEWFPAIIEGEWYLVDLYRLWPLIVRTRDLLASGLSEEIVEGESPNLRLLTNALLREPFGTVAEDIRQFGDLVDPVACPLSYLPYLAAALVAEYAPEWPSGRQRLLVQSIVHLWHASGTHPAVRAIFSLHERTGWYAHELWKSQVYETHQWRWEETVGYSVWYKAARIDVRDATGDAVSWDPDVREWVSRVIRNLCPIHVLVRSQMTMYDLADLSWPTSCDSACEAGCETGGEVFDNVLIPTQVDEATGMSASVAIELSCASACETGCEASICETGCELGACETGCEGLCETGCQGACELGCEVACTAACTVGCEADCQIGCEGACELGCEIGCETDEETGEE